MFSGVKTAAFMASAGSGIAIIVSLIVIGNLFMEVNDMYREVLAEMDEFKAMSNEAWKGMMDRNRHLLTFDSVFRIKRQYDAGVTGGTQSRGGGGGGGGCQCARQASSCPAGPPGPPGQPGEPGLPGDRGQDGGGGQATAGAASHGGGGCTNTRTYRTTMELYLFRHKTWEKLYSCDHLTPQEWKEKRVARVPHGIFSIAFSAVALMLYIPCLRVLKRKDFMQNTCYKIMFYLGIVDVMSQLLDGFLMGYFLIVGALFCDMPHFMFLTGTLTFATWGVQCALCLLLAVNRFVDLCIGRNANEALFSGSRTNIWCALAACYGIILVFVPPTLVFSSTLGSLFYDPYVGFENITEVDRSWYFNPIMGINNIATVSSLFVLYTAMLITITLKSMRSGGNVHIQISIFYQAALICLLNAVPALEYLYMQFFSAPQWLIAAGHFGWQASNGGPAFIYVFFNKTIQRNVLKMFGMKGRTATMFSGVKTAAFMASAGSGIAIIVSLIVIGNLFMEVNDMYREVLAEMDEFKAMSNEAWKGMMDQPRRRWRMLPTG
ncbi:hypothetical protein QR680_015916 [Steinernema hermaphroditum]|uniref:Nematode cuticle collagen N-terminal domain-containing protein n=1 Tax=Steinernema hermaphroditum TaxID=289476 RepID=A0AA39H9P6_9BILA|nr:hypothetical protein QR680_015916 [Steinernema hermaphroditum]